MSGTSTKESTNLFGDDSRFHHIGYAVNRISDVAPNAVIFQDPIQRVNVAFEQVHGVLLEYVEPLDRNSPIKKLLDARQSIYHVCFDVPDLRVAVTCAQRRGLFLLRRPKPAVAFGGRSIAWVSHTHLGLFELLQR